MDIKKFFGALILLCILYISSLNNYYSSSIEYYHNNCFWLALIDWLIISVALMIVPFIWKLINKKRFDRKKGKLICLFNSIFHFILSVILQVSIGLGYIGGVAAFIFYFINKWFFVDESLVIDKKKSKKRKKRIKTS